MTQDLKPCPFCGSTDVKLYEYPAQFDSEPSAFVQCKVCSTGGPEGKSGDAATSAWNSRAALTAPAQVPMTDVMLDEVIELAEAMEVRRILEEIKVVAASCPADIIPNPYQAAWHSACEEIFYRATGRRWHMDEDATRFNHSITQQEAGK